MRGILTEKRGVTQLRKLLSKVHCITFSQAKYILEYYGGANSRAEEEIARLVRSKYLFQTGQNIQITPSARPNQYVIQAVWVLIKFINSIDIDNCYLSMSPSTLFLLMDNTMYEIIIPDKNREGVIASRIKYHNKSNKDVSYMILCEDFEQVEKMDEELVSRDIKNVIYLVDEGFDYELGKKVISMLEKEE